MSTAGLRKVGNFESALAQATRDEQHIDGIISPYLQNEATKIINHPEFQRVKDRLQDDLAEQQRNHITTELSNPCSRISSGGAS